MLTGSNIALLSASRLIRKVYEVERAYDAPHANLNLIGPTIVNSLDLNAIEI